jgi:putative oxidoreductase
MLVAYLTADREALFSSFSNPGKFYGADPYTFLFAAALILIFGPGRFALSSFIAHR